METTDSTKLSLCITLSVSLAAVNSQCIIACCLFSATFGTTTFAPFFFYLNKKMMQKAETSNYIFAGNGRERIMIEL